MITLSHGLKNILRPIRNSVRRVADMVSWDPWTNRSWSQEGEDLILNRMLEDKVTGFYVDVGAHHPKRFSNTHLFYRRGWSGINIDAMPGSMKLFSKLRRRDTNLEIGIDQEASSVDYYIFNETALNGFSSELANERHNSETPYFIKQIIQVEVKTLSEVLSQYANGRTIDFMSVDVEGFDLRVLKSNDWIKYRPKIVLAEILASNLDELSRDELVKFMSDKGYEVCAKTANTVFFVDGCSREHTA